MTKTKRQMQKEQTKDLLIRTAYEVFSKHGILASRMSDIAEAAGVSHGTVFLHFQTQEALIEEVVAEYTNRIAASTHILAESSVDFEELLRAHISAIIEYEPFYTRLVIENRLLPPGARDCWIAVQSVISHHFSLVYERTYGPTGKETVPLFMIFNMWMGLVHYYLSNGDLFAPDGHVLQRHGETLIRYFLNLLSGVKNDGE